MRSGSGSISGFGEESGRIPGVDEEGIMDEEESFKEEGDIQSEELDDGRNPASLFIFLPSLLPPCALSAYVCMD